TSLGGDFSDTPVGQDAAEVPADTSMPSRNPSTTRRRLRKPFSSFASAHIPEDVPAGASVPAAATTIPAGSSMDAAVRAVAALSSSIPTVTDKGKAPMVDDSFPADLLSEQEHVLKNLHDSQLREELAKNIHAEQEVKFARQQEELTQKAQVERVASSTEHGPGMSDQHDVTEENMNERLGMLLLRKRQELAEQSRVKPMTKTQQRDYMRDFVKNNSASVYNQGWTMRMVKALSIAQLRLEFEYIQQHPERSNLLNFRRSAFQPKPTLDAPSAKRTHQGAPQVPAASSQVPAGVPAAPSFPANVSVHAATSSTPADISVPAVSPAHNAAYVPAETVVHTVDDDDPLPYTPYAGWEIVPFPLGSIHAYHDMAGHTKHFTTLRELLYMVEKTDLQKLLGSVDELYQKEDPDTFALLFWRLYPRAQVHILETVDGWVIYMFVDVSYPLSAATLERMPKHGLEVPKMLVGGDLTMAEQLVGFIKAALLNAKSTV
nr:aminoacyl-tRNA synthetase, class 1a, anticodon-binding [Tanacetum cinerariifolium]